MSEERTRPQGGRPDTASLIQKLFRDEPEEAQPLPPDQESTPPVGVVTPPDAGPVPAEPGPGVPAEPASSLPVGVEGTLQVPPLDEAEPAGEGDGRTWFVIHTYSGYENKV